MKIALFLFLMLLNCSTLFAYEVKVTKLTDENFDPLPNYIQPEFGGAIKDYQEIYKYKQIATMTLIFGLVETVQDFDAAVTLAKKEAAKLGANLVYYVSNTLYKDTKDIASITFRCIRIDDVNQLLIDSHLRPKQYTGNKFEVQKDGKVIYGQTTGLMWQKSGSEYALLYLEAHNYIRQLNQEGFAGYNDWRLPTLKEAITLLKPAKTNNDLFVDTLFDNKQKWIWTSDLYSASSAWVVDFSNGHCYSLDVFYYGYYVRAVR